MSVLVALYGAWQYGQDPYTGMNYITAMLSLVTAIASLLFSFILPLLDYWLYLEITAIFGLDFSPTGWVMTANTLVNMASIGLFLLSLGSDLTDTDDVSNLPFT